MKNIYYITFLLFSITTSILHCTSQVMPKCCVCYPTIITEPGLFSLGGKELAGNWSSIPEHICHAHVLNNLYVLDEDLQNNFILTNNKLDNIIKQNDILNKTNERVEQGEVLSNKHKEIIRAQLVIITKQIEALNHTTCEQTEKINQLAVIATTLNLILEETKKHNELTEKLLKLTTLIPEKK